MPLHHPLPACKSQSRSQSHLLRTTHAQLPPYPFSRQSITGLPVELLRRARRPLMERPLPLSAGSRRGRGAAATAGAVGATPPNPKSARAGVAGASAMGGVASKPPMSSSPNKSVDEPGTPPVRHSAADQAFKRHHLALHVLAFPPCKKAPTTQPSQPVVLVPPYVLSAYRLYPSRTLDETVTAETTQPHIALLRAPPFCVQG